MSKNIVRKIISAILFIISVYFIWLIFSQTSTYFGKNKGIIYFGALFFLNLLLFILNFSFRTEKIYVTKQHVKKENISNIFKTDQNLTSDTEIKINAIISELERVKDNQNFPDAVLKAFAKAFYIVQGLVYVKYNESFKAVAVYALSRDIKKVNFSEGQGIPGQVAKNKKIKQINDIPEEYIQVVSGLGAASPRNLIFIPILRGNETVALIEAAAFEKFPDDLEQFQSKLNKAFAEKLIQTENDK